MSNNILTTRAIIKTFENIGHDPQNEEYFNKTWISVDEEVNTLKNMLDTYANENNLVFKIKEHICKIREVYLDEEN